MATMAGGEYTSVKDFYRDRSIFITGGTGFMGKVLVEKLLRSCPDIKNIYLLMRPKKGQNVQERLQELLNAPVIIYPYFCVFAISKNLNHISFVSYLKNYDGILRVSCRRSYLWLVMSRNRNWASQQTIRICWYDRYRSFFIQRPPLNSTRHWNSQSP